MDINKLITKLQKSNNKIRIVFPEGNNELIQNVAQRLIVENIAIPVLIFDTKEQFNLANKLECEKICIENYDTKSLAQELFTLRNGKIDSLETAHKLVQQSNYFATMLLHQNKVDAYLGGINYSTGNTILPGLQIIKTKPGINIISSSMIMKKNKDVKFFSDIAINIDPSSEQLAQITIQCAQLISSFGLKPQMALLSFSTKGSAKHPLVDKVIQAGNILKQKKPDFTFEAEMQFDAVVDAKIRNKKAPNCTLTNEVNGFIFPDLNSGNIGYKIAQRLGAYEAIGPVITGFNKVINDLSRGANEQEIFLMAIVSAIQAKEK